MDINIFNMCLLCLAYVAATVAMENSKESPDWLSRSIRATRREKNKGNRHDASLSSLTNSGTQESCCQNGGICIMNTFCHCKKNFYGRYCEHRVRHRSCGTIRHGTWMASGCHLCHCFDGQMTCKVTTIRGCDHLSYIEGYEQDPDYMVGMDKKVEDYDKFYDDYEYPTGADDNASSSGSGTHELPLWIVAVALLVASRHVIS